MYYLRCLGVATAAGCQLVATCDMAVASDKSTFAVPGYVWLFFLRVISKVSGPIISKVVFKY